MIELTVVILVIAILMGFIFTAGQATLDRSRKVQAKNDVTQIVTAVNAFYNEYGQYPCGAQSGGDDQDYVAADNDTGNLLMNDLRNFFPTHNPRGIVFAQIPFAKDLSNPRGGIGGNGRFYDPWGSVYRIKIDNNYNNVLTNPYTPDTKAGPQYLQLGIIAWSFGKDKTQGTDFSKSDDVISWQ